MLAPPPQPFKPINKRIDVSAAIWRKARSKLWRHARQDSSKKRKSSTKRSVGIACKRMRGLSGNDGASGMRAPLPEVETVTEKLVVELFETPTLEGTLHVAPSGAPVHAKVSVPLKPVPGTACRLN